jgi:serine/threonine-protein kinase
LILTVTEGPHKGLSFTFSGHDTFLVGRSKHAHFQLPFKDKYFSRIHFMVEVNPPLCRLNDMRSHNGTYVNGKQVQTADLHDGDEIQAGHTVLTVSIPKPAASASAAHSPAPLPETPTATLQRGLETLPYPPSGKAPAVPVQAPVVPGYEIVRELGRGGMGVVYEAVRQADGKPVALKTVVPAVMADPLAVQRFLREASILCELQHAHIVAFYEMGEVDNRFYFAMELVAGTDAVRMLREHGPLPVRTAVRLVCQALSGLAHAHDKGYVHRDIKPANILIAEEPGKKTVKLADFGLARIYQASQLSGLTMQGTVGGSFPFMPPEQATNFRTVQPPADQYSTAATLYNLLTNRYLYDFQWLGPECLAVILTEDPVPIQKRRTDLPAGLADVIHRALAREPEDRFPDVQAFRQALLPFGQ